MRAKTDVLGIRVLVLERAAFTDHLECLKYAHENGCPWSEETCQSCR